EEHLGSGWMRGLHPQDADGFLALYQRAVAAGEPVRGECRMRRADGEYRRVLVSAARCGASAAYVGAVVDLGGAGQGAASQEEARELADLEGARALAAASEARFRTLVDVAPVGVFQTDGAGRTVFTNQRWRELTGFSAEEMRRDG